MTPQLERELAAYLRFRSDPLNIHRIGSACAASTVNSDQTRVLALLAWMEKRGATISLGGVFSSAALGATVKTYLMEVRGQGGIKWSTCAKRVASFLSVARFVHSARQAQAPDGSIVPTTATDQLAALHLQCQRSSKQESKFTLAKKPVHWLSWRGAQLARAAAKRALVAYKGKSTAKRHQLKRDVCLLTILTVSPPDR